VRALQRPSSSRSSRPHEVSAITLRAGLYAVFAAEQLEQVVLAARFNIPFDQFASSAGKLPPTA
jgi:hypothetical protein